MELYHEWLPENKKIILENRLNQLENELILDITGQFGAVLETEAEKNKWALIILALIPIFQTIYQINIRKIYEDTAQRILNIMIRQQEITDIDKTQGIGVAIPGPVDIYNRVMPISNNLVGFENYKIADLKQFTNYYMMAL